MKASKMIISTSTVRAQNKIERMNQLKSRLPSKFRDIADAKGVSLTLADVIHLEALDISENIMHEADCDRDGKLCRSEFIEWAGNGSRNAKRIMKLFSAFAN